MISVVRCGRLIQGNGVAPLDRGVLILDGDRVEAVGREGELSVPESARVHDFSGLAVLPGLIDAHSHLGYLWDHGSPSEQMQQPPERLAIKGTIACRRLLRQGVTTAREMGNRGFVDLAVRDAVERGHIPGPRLLCATRGFRASRGQGSVAIVMEGADELRSAVRENVARGADFVKLFVSGSVLMPREQATRSFYTRDEIVAAVDEAHSMGKKVAVHCVGGESFSHSLEAGVDFIEHGGYLNEEDLALFSKYPSATLTITLSVLARAEMEVPPEERGRIRRIQADAEATFGRVRELGIAWIAGTDNADIADEVEALCRNGASPEEALGAVGARAAHAIGVGSDVGTLEPGKFADLIAVRGDPLADTGCLRSIAWVMKGGVLYDPAAL